MNVKKSILLITTAYNLNGHSYEYVNNFVNQLCQYYKIDIFYGRGLYNREFNTQADFIDSEIDFSGTDGQRFRTFGRFDDLFRGVTKFLVNLRFYRKLLKENHGKKHDYIFLMDYDYIAMFYYLFLNRKERNIVVWVHSASFRSSSILYTLYKSLVKFFFRLLSNSVRTFIVNGTEVEKEFIKNVPEARNKTVVIQYVSDIGKTPLNKNEARELLNISEDKKVVLFFGILRKDKNIEAAVKAMAELNVAEKLLVVAGAENSVTANDINSYCQAHGLTDIYKCIKYLTEDEINLFYSAADLLLIPYDVSNQSQSGPLSLAQRYGVPVITREGGELGSFIADNKLGLVAPIDGLVDIIDDFFKNDVIEDEIKKNIKLYYDLNKSSGVFEKYRDVFI